MGRKRLHEDCVLVVGAFSAKFHAGQTIIETISGTYAQAEKCSLDDVSDDQDIDDLISLLEIIRVAGWCSFNQAKLARAWGKND